MAIQDILSQWGEVVSDKVTVAGGDFLERYLESQVDKIMPPNSSPSIVENNPETVWYKHQGTTLGQNQSQDLKVIPAGSESPDGVLLPMSIMTGLAIGVGIIGMALTIKYVAR